MKFPLNLASKCPPRGVVRAGRYSVRFFSEPFDKTGGGDLWDVGMFEEGEFDPGGIVLLVGDVMGHGQAARILSEQAGVIKLFRACLSQIVGNFTIVKLLKMMDRELSRVNLPEGTFVQVTLAYFTGMDAGVCAHFTPETALVSQHTTAHVDHTLSMTAFLLRLSWFRIRDWWSSVRAVTQAFPQHAELVLGTDGLYEQPTSANALKDDLIRDLPAFRTDLPLIGQVQRCWRKAVEDSQQLDDMLVASVRHMDDDEQMVFQAREGDALAADAFFKKYNRLVCKLVRKLVKAEATGTDGGDASVLPGISRDDLAQDVWLHLFSNLSKWSGGVIYSWVERITVNYVISWLRKRGTVLRRQKEQSIGAMEIPDSSGLDSVDEVQHRELTARAYAYLRQLPDRRRKLLEMRQEGCSEPEILVKLDISRRTYFNWMNDIKSNFPK